MEINNSKKIHFIAIGGSAMHNLAIALKRAGNNVSGSDDQIFEPSKSRLAKEGLLPESEGWFPEKIAEADEIVLGMHAKAGNPELDEAMRLNKKLMSYPEFLGQCFQNDFRLVIAGSHGKTTITSMLLHVINAVKRDVKYMVGAQLDGFDCMVKLTAEENFAVIEGDEYLSSPLDKRSKFLWYKPNLAIITGIAWDHFNVFKTEADYFECFTEFVKSLAPDATLLYINEAHVLPAIKKSGRADVTLIPYDLPAYKVEEGKYFVENGGKKCALSVIGKHNMYNVEGARLLAQNIGIDDQVFYQALQSFTGAAKRLESYKFKNVNKAYRDFAHAPSKVKATVDGVREAYPNKKIVAFLELHTYSSLNPNFIPKYKSGLNSANEAYVYFDKHALEIKQMAALNKEDIKNAFQHNNLQILTNKNDLEQALAKDFSTEDVVLFLSSGNFGGMV